MRSLLTVHNLVVGYPDRVVLSAVNLELAAGEILPLVGPNGAGKTTLLKTLVGILPKLGGEAKFASTKGPVVVGYVPQNEIFDPIFPLRALDVVLMGTYQARPWWRMVGAKEQERALVALDRVGLTGEVTRRSFFHLSGGQRQRVLIARAIVAEAQILFLDEPLVGVDHASEGAIIELLDTLRAEVGLTIVLVTHHLEWVRKRMPDCLWVADGGARRMKTADLKYGQSGLHV